MDSVSLYLSLGSNIGDREANLRTALDLLDERLGFPPAAISSMIESDAWMFDGPCFLNCAVLYRLPLPEVSPRKEARRILDICKGIEKEMGRTDVEEYALDGRRIYHSRIIDIDILFYGDLRMNTKKLTIPHKGIYDRPFVTGPLSEIAEPSLKEEFPEYFTNIPQND